MTAVARESVRGAGAAGADLGAGDVLRPAHRRAVPALRRAGDPQGELTWTLAGPDAGGAAGDARRHRDAGRRASHPSADLAAVARSADVGGRGSARGCWASRPSGSSWTDARHLRWRLGGGPRRVLLLGHHDTVWPLGSLATHPFAVDGGVLRGPGCFDMKAGRGAWPCTRGGAASGRVRATRRDRADHRRRGARLAELAGAGRGRGAPAARPPWCSRRRPTAARSRPSARASRSTRCGSPAGPPHAGLEPERGVNATVELAHQVLAVQRAGRPAAGAPRVTPTVLVGRHHGEHGARGRRVHASTCGSAHVGRAGPGRRRHAGAARRCWPARGVEVTGGPNRPPLPAVVVGRRCSPAPRAVAADSGLPPLPGSRWAGRPTATSPPASARPTLDGLGAVGGGAHADDEHVLIAELPGRAALVAALVADSSATRRRRSRPIG